MAAFASYGVFAPMMSNAVRMTLINTAVNPQARAFFILLAAHDGPGIEAVADVKIVAVTSPQLFEELRQRNPLKAREILSDEERQHVIALHNGWPGFLYPFLLPPDYPRRVFGMDQFSRSGKPDEIYAHAGFDPAGLRDKIISNLR
jgi:transketolase